MKLRHLSLCLIVIAISNGCKSSALTSRVHQGEYEIRGVFVEAPYQVYKTMNITSVAIESSSFEKLRSSPRVKLTKLPVVYIDVGEKRKIDNQKPMRYPTAHDEEGTPTDYATRGVGEMMEVELKSVTNDIASCFFDIQQVDGPIWRPYGLENSSREIKMPFFHSFSISTGIKVYLNAWAMVGGVTRGSGDKPKQQAFFVVQIQESQNAQSTEGDR